MFLLFIVVIQYGAYFYYSLLFLLYRYIEHGLCQHFNIQLKQRFIDFRGGLMRFWNVKSLLYVPMFVTCA